MNTPPMNEKVTPFWSAYAKSVTFLLPALVAWWFSAIFLLPKLQQIWADAGFSEPVFLAIMHWANLLLSQGVWILAAVVFTVGLLEWHGGAWLRYRRTSLAIGTWLVNAAVLLLMTAMLLSALIAAPGLVARP